MILLSHEGLGKDGIRDQEQNVPRNLKLENKVGEGENSDTSFTEINPIWL